MRRYLPKISKWITLAACMPVALSGGLGYLFSVWSPALKEPPYSLDQKSIEIIAAIGNVGGYLSFISGIVYDSLDHRHHLGPRLSLAIGCLVNFIGFFALWYSISGRFIATTWQLALFTAIAGNGGTWYDTSILTTNTRNFPANRGSIVGILKALVGLSASWYAVFFVGFFRGHIDHFLLFLAIVPAAIGFLAVPLVNYVPYVEDSELQGGYTTFSPEGRFLFAFQGILTLALYLMATALTTAFESPSTEGRLLMSIGALLLVCPLAYLPAGNGGLFARRANVLVRAPTDLWFLDDYRFHEDDEEDEEDGELDDESRRPLVAFANSSPFSTNTPASPVQRSPVGANVRQPPDMPSYTLNQSVCQLNFWLCAAIFGICIGAGLAYLNNIAQIVVSLSGAPQSRSVLVSIFGVASCVGRLTFGAWPERALHSRYNIPRPAFLVLSSIMMSVTCAGIAYTHIPALYALSFVIGLGFGANWSLLPSLCSELFGLKSFASIYTVLQLSPAAVGYAFGAGLIGEEYAEIGRKHGDEPGMCFGSDCFQKPFLIMAALSGMAVLLSIILMVRTVSVYRAQAVALKAFPSS